MTDISSLIERLCDWILGFLEAECSLDPACVSKADRRNIQNAIQNTLTAAFHPDNVEALSRLTASPLPVDVAEQIDEEKLAQAVRIRALEAELADYKSRAECWREAALGKAEVEAVWAKTIEECAAIFDIEGWGTIMHSEAAKRIRALNQPSNPVEN